MNVILLSTITTSLLYYYFSVIGLYCFCYRGIISEDMFHIQTGENVPQSIEFDLGNKFII